MPLRTFVKKTILSILHSPVDKKNKQLEAGWSIISEYLVGRYFKIFNLIGVSSIAAVLEGATMGLLGLAISTFVDDRPLIINMVPGEMGTWFQEVSDSIGRDELFLLLVLQF